MKSRIAPARLRSAPPRIDSVLVKEVDAVSPEALQHLLDDLADVVGPAVPPSVRELETELRREDYLVTNWLERFANERLVHVRPVRFSRVKNVIPSSCAPRMTLMSWSVSTGSPQLALRPMQPGPIADFRTRDQPMSACRRSRTMS
jgi:hypothetical protein